MPRSTTCVRYIDSTAGCWVLAACVLAGTLDRCLRPQYTCLVAYQILCVLLASHTACTVIYIHIYIHTKERERELVELLASQEGEECSIVLQQLLAVG
jgi:hypothetical protein